MFWWADVQSCDEALAHMNGLMQAEGAAGAPLRGEWFAQIQSWWVISQATTLSQHQPVRHAMLCCAVLCCAVLRCAVLCCAVLCYAMLCYAMLYPAGQPPSLIGMTRTGCGLPLRFRR
jgi:hypothetical protein